MIVWAIYERPSDFREGFLARRWEGEQFTFDIRTGATLEEVRRALPAGLVRVPRHVSDDPVIVEVWL